MIEIVTTRLGQLYEADDPKQQMGLDVPSIFDVHTYRWGGDHTGEGGRWVRDEEAL